VQVRSPAGSLDDLKGHMDRVLVDAPCTGTGVWRRRPDAKWRVTSEALQKRIAEQDAVLREAAEFVKPGGALAYATCSVLPPENGEQVSAFLRAHPTFRALPMRQAWDQALADVSPPDGALADTSLLLTPRRSGTDGFFVACLRRDD
jgi:16S rRNA (cytosine967-C5)-methyltransferase